MDFESLSFVGEPWTDLLPCTHNDSESSFIDPCFVGHPVMFTPRDACEKQPIQGPSMQYLSRSGQFPPEPVSEPLASNSHLSTVGLAPGSGEHTHRWTYKISGNGGSISVPPLHPPQHPYAHTPFLSFHLHPARIRQHIQLHYFQIFPCVHMEFPHTGGWCSW